MENNQDNKFFSKWFFRSSNGESFIWLSLLWNYNKNIPQLWFYYINSWLKFKPHQILNLEELKNLLLFFKSNEKSYIFQNLSIKKNTEEYKITIFNKQEQFSFMLQDSEFFLLQSYLIYCINYLENKDLLIEINENNYHLEKSIKELLQKEKGISMKKYNDTVYKNNLIKDKNGEIKKISIPIIEHELHGQKNWIKTWYYFKFFDEYLENIRNMDKSKIQYNWEKYPIQIVIQEWKESEIITLTEIELYKLLSFLNSIVSWNFKDSSTYTKNNEYSVTLENSYNWKKYINKDILSEEDYKQLCDLKELKDTDSIINKLKQLRSSNKLINNKFFDKNVISTLKLEKKEFINFSISHWGILWIDEKSWIFQIWNIVWNKEATMNIVKGEIDNWGKQYLSVLISEKDIYSLNYKIKSFIEIMNNPINIGLLLMYKQLETIRYLDKSKNSDLIKKEFINKILMICDDSKMLKTVNIVWDNSSIIIKLFTPNIIKQLNMSIFNLKWALEWLQDDRYPLNLKIENKEDKSIYFNLGLSNLLLLYNKVLKWEEFSLEAKNWKFKKIVLQKLEDKIHIDYYEGISKDLLNNSKSIFLDNFEYKKLWENLSYIYNNINIWIKNLIIKAIVYSNNKIKYD